MGYSTKWIEDNLGITKETISGYEDTKYGLLPPNIGGRRRDFSEEDVQWIWTIRLLQGIGFSRMEIRQMADDSKKDFQDILVKNIGRLEEHIRQAEIILNYVKEIKFSGRIPDVNPQLFGKIKINDFYKRALNQWDIIGHHSNSAQDMLKAYETIGEVAKAETLEEVPEQVLRELLRLLKLYGEMLKNEQNNIFFIKEIVKRKEKGAKDSEVQLLVKIIYENMLKNYLDISPQKFAHIFGASFVDGDVGEMNKEYYGKEECEFIADASAVFGGYDDFNTLLEQCEEKEFGVKY